jgi:hypothetical protein
MSGEGWPLLGVWGGVLRGGVGLVGWCWVGRVGFVGWCEVGWVEVGGIEVEMLQCKWNPMTRGNA